MDLNKQDQKTGETWGEYMKRQNIRPEVACACFAKVAYVQGRIAGRQEGVTASPTTSPNHEHPSTRANMSNKHNRRAPL